MMITLGACGKTADKTIDTLESHETVEEMTEQKHARADQGVQEDSKKLEEKDGVSDAENAVEDNVEVKEEVNQKTEDVEADNSESYQENNSETEDSELEEKLQEEGGEATDEKGDVDVDPYVGEYNSYDIDEPGLEIQRNEDGTYNIHIGIYRVIQLYQCVGTRTDNGIDFSTTEWDGNDFSGTITLEGDVAVVTFTSEDWDKWLGVEEPVKEYRYHKVSEIPDMDVPDYMEE